MTVTKQQLLNDSTVTNQQAIVDRLSNDKKKNKKIVIPAGKKIYDYIDDKNLESAILTWLRGTRFFDRVELSFARDPSAVSTETIKLHEFDSTTLYPAWMHINNGRHMLAARFAKAIKDNKNIVSIVADREGIHIKLDKKKKFSIEAENFEPYIEFVPRKTRYE